MTRDNVIQHSKPYYSEEDEKFLISCLNNGFTAANGPFSEKIKDELKKYFNCLDVHLTSSGTTALMLALISLGIKQKDTVILPTYLCREVYDAVKFIGSNPVLLDINEDTYTLDKNSIYKHINQDVKAIIFPHMFGISGCVHEVIDLGIPVIEDISQGLGALLNKKLTGTFGNVAILSFKSIKMLGGGEGGALIINDPEASERINNYIKGKNLVYPPLLFQMSDLTAALVYSQWGRLNDFIAKRQDLAHKYIRDLQGVNAQLPKYNIESSWFRFPIKLNNEYNFTQLKEEFYNRGVSIRRPVDYLLNQKLNIPGLYPVAEEVIKKVISLPLYPSLKDEELHKVVFATRDLLK